MSNPPPSAPSEKTFTSYTKEEGTKYAKARPGYHANLYKIVIEQHTSTGGQHDTILDVGCGPGTAVRALAPLFTHAIGIDPSSGMINSARDLGDDTKISEPIRFEISTAEDLGCYLTPPIQDSSIDLITASTAAHWFDMAKFWPAAARVLKPGGSVALWCTGGSQMHPDVPNAAAIQTAIDEIDKREIQPFVEPGNLIAKHLYVDLPLPWTLDTPVQEFDEKSFFRKEWGPQYGNSQEFYGSGAMTMDLDTMDKIASTLSPIQRWREAHPDAEVDVSKMYRREIERLLHEAGVEKGKETIKVETKGVLLIVKKRA